MNTEKESKLAVLSLEITKGFLSGVLCVLGMLIKKNKKILTNNRPSLSYY